MNKTYYLLFLLLLSTTTFSQSTVTFVGHRGASYLAPENTLAAYELAWELGVTAAECDIMLTKDNKIVVFHDKNGKRLTGKDFVVKDVDYNQIESFEIKLKDTNLEKYSGQNIPLLSELLSTIPEGKTLVIEIKTGPEILPYLKDVIRDDWKTGNIAFIAFDFETILATKDLFPDTPCYYLSSFEADINKKFDQIKESQLDGVNLRYKIIDKKLVMKFAEINKGVWCWTVNDPEETKKLISYGVTAITTDRPKWLKESIEN